MSLGHLQAQVVINLPQTNIINRSEFQQTSNVGNYAHILISVGLNINAKANTVTFNSTPNIGTVPLNVAHLKLESINGISLLGNSKEIALSMSNQPIYATTLSLSLTDGPTMVIFRLLTGNQTWVAGTYATTLTFTPTGLNAGTITPPTTSFSINVPAFIAAPTTIGTTSLVVDNLSFYRSANGISSNTNISLSGTVPYLPTIRTDNASQFTFTSSSPYNIAPDIPVSTVNASLTSIPTMQNVSLSSSNQVLTTATSLAVPSNNNVVHTYTFSISAAQLKNSFAQAGKYSTSLAYSWQGGSPNTGTSAEGIAPLEITVSDLSELVLNPAQQTVNFTFSTAEHYKNGISQDMPAHLKLSKTTPYNLYVRATTPNFSSGINTIPLDVLRIGPASGETGMNTVTLSTTAQKLIESANPVIDRNISIGYSIPANQTSKLLNKPTGTYSTNVIFSFVAP